MIPVEEYPGINPPTSDHDVGIGVIACVVFVFLFIIVPIMALAENYDLTVIELIRSVLP